MTSTAKARWSGVDWAPNSSFHWLCFSGIQLGLDIPLVLFQDRPDSIPGVNGLTELGVAGIGAPRFVPKIRVLNQKEHGLSLAVMPTFVLPNLMDGEYFGQDTWSFEPELAVGRDFKAFVLLGNLGYRIRQKETFVNLEIDDELFMRAGAGLRLEHLGGPPLGIDLSIAGATSADKPLARGNRDYGEVLAGARYPIFGPLIAFAGGGIGINRGFGTPDWRVFGGLRWSRMTFDRDNDGIVDGYDACPDTPEDPDGFQDTDGCPTSTTTATAFSMSTTARPTGPKTSTASRTATVFPTPTTTATA